MSFGEKYANQDQTSFFLEQHQSWVPKLEYPPLILLMFNRYS